MKGDFSRDTFEASKHFSRVLMQQGRVQLDADWNEQTSILLHYLQTLAADLIGPFGGPTGAFKLKEDGPGFTIGKGHYYVDGVLCENDAEVGYTKQRGYPFQDSKALEDVKASSEPFLVYLDVWERHITALEDERLREVALGGPDTCSRAQVVWQVKAWPSNENDRPEQLPSDLTCGAIKTKWDDWKKLLQPEHRGQLVARPQPADVNPSKPCITPPEARYRGAENQLYRVEIHRGGPAWIGKIDNRKLTGNAQQAATFKWSRDNGSVVFPILTLGGQVATLANLGRDGRLTLEPDDWVEIVDDDQALSGQPGPMAQVDKVDSASRIVTFKANPVPRQGSQSPTYEANSTKHPLLRRWDHQAGNPTEGGLVLSETSEGAALGAALIKEDNESWLLLEDGVQIQFQPPKTKTGQNQYRTGDYWLIPARTATGDVEWPNETDADGNPVYIAQPPHGITHHYAPLRIITVSGNKVILGADLRCISPAAACTP
jgi:hypothetical protein